MNRAKNSLQAKAAVHIQNGLMTGTFNWGDRVSEEAIAKEIGISRTPVREALHTFTQLGIFRRIPRYGTIVCVPDIEKFRDMFEMRLALESYAIGAITPDAAALDRMESLCEPFRECGRAMRAAGRDTLDAEEIRRVLSADLAFHQEIIRILGNTVMERYLGDTNLLLRIFTAPRVRRFDLPHIAQVYRFHRRIVRALRKGLQTQARELLEAHIRRSAADASALMEDLLADYRRNNPSGIEGFGLPASL